MQDNRSSALHINRGDELKRTNSPIH